MIGSDAFGAQFEGSEGALLPMEIDDNAPGQLMLPIIRGETNFFANEGAARFVVYGKPLPAPE